MPEASPVSQLRRLSAHAMFHGGVAGVLGAAWLWAALHYDFLYRPFVIMGIVAPVGGIVVAVQRWRDRGLGGTIRFSQAAGAALAVGLVFAAVVALAGALFAQAGGTAFLERLARLQAEALQASGKTAEEIAAMDSTLRAQYSPGLFGWAMFRSLLPIVLVISLVAAAFVRKRV